MNGWKSCQVGMGAAPPLSSSGTTDDRHTAGRALRDPSPASSGREPLRPALACGCTGGRGTVHALAGRARPAPRGGRSVSRARGASRSSPWVRRTWSIRARAAGLAGAVGAPGELHARAQARAGDRDRVQLLAVPAARDRRRQDRDAEAAGRELRHDAGVPGLERDPRVDARRGAGVDRARRGRRCRAAC